MGLLQSLEGMAGQNGQNAKESVTNGLMQALEEHPGGLAGVLQQFRQNGMDQHVQSWATGQQAQATPQQIQQGMGDTGLLDNVAAKAGVSPETAKVALAAILPVVVAHFTRGGQQEPPQSGFSGMASQILSRVL